MSSSQDYNYSVASWFTASPTTPFFPYNKECNNISYTYDIPTAIVCGVCFVFGIIFVFFGYRCFKAIMFLVGFILAALVVYMICEEESSLDRPINAAIALGIGILCGTLTMLIEVVGLFLTGIHLGIFVSVAVLIIMEQFYTPTELIIPILILFGLGIVFAMLTLKFQKQLVILATSFIGGAIVTSCADYFLEKFRMVQYVYDLFLLGNPFPLCWYSWLIFGLWPFVAVVGTLVQFNITSKGYNHKEASKTAKARRVELQKIRQREEKQAAEEPAQKYCDLHRARSRHADVVTQSYLQSIQNHLSPEMQRIASLQHIPSEPQLVISTPTTETTEITMPPQTTVTPVPDIQKDGGMTEV